MINNPIIPGFYPDPSIVRVEDDFYLVTSSFSFFPGVPIFHSRDLTHWEQIGYVLDRPSQLPLTHEMISGGIFAPTIRYNKGTFYMITTNMSLGCKNFIVTAKDPKGPWSEMHILEGADGIDPSLFFDDDGKVYYTGTTGFGNEQGIYCSQIDLEKMELVGERKILWQGALKGAASPEGPHLYKKDGWYYLMIAEGGTEHFHAITISRSKEIMGEYKGYEGNPILTHRHLGKNYPICNVGHGDLVELKDGSWYMVMLGSRLMKGYHKILGRETFLAPVTWEDGWPIVSYGTGKVEFTYPSPDSLQMDGGNHSDGVLQRRVEHFDSPVLGLEWNYLGTPKGNFAKIEDSCLKLQLLKNQLTPWEMDGASANIFERFQLLGKSEGCVSFLGRRQQHINFEAAVKIIFRPEDKECAGLVILQNDAHQLRLECSKGDGGRIFVSCIATRTQIENGKQYYKETCMGSVQVDAGNNENALILKIQGEETDYSFYAGLSGDELKLVAEKVDGSFLGSETAGGFVGAYIGMYASGVTETKEKYAAFDYFDYQPK
ncbi:MAG TPA: glycoside hydrolase family 43 protein [Clostridiales bacterium]|nr:glycoside hydrolase family 43 protein [Clostridiales bacterium]